LSCGDWGVVSGEVLDDAGDGDGVAVESGLVETFVDDLVELGVGAALEEGVELGYGGCTWMRVLR
jgi:hypothetical protein